MSSGPRPIFIIGSLRSGASLLTWSLGQHPHIQPLLDNSWLEPFAASLERTYAAAVSKRSVSHLDSLGIESEDFHRHFGESINSLLLAKSDRVRWVDGSPAHSFNVVGLRRLFPLAKFVHVVRDVAEVVAALTDEDKRPLYRSHWQRYTEAAAYGHWLETVTACVQAERAYGSDTILRLRRHDLINEPEATLRRCLAFVGEPFAPACLRPFR